LSFQIKQTYNVILGWKNKSGVSWSDMYGANVVTDAEKAVFAAYVASKVQNPWFVWGYDRD